MHPCPQCLSKAMQEADNVPKSVKFTIYLNVVGVVVLEEPTDEFSDQSSQESPEAFRVDKTMDYVKPEATEEVVETEGVEFRNKELAESFL